MFDLKSASPPEALSTEPAKHHWRMVPWKGNSGDHVLEGTMLMIGPETEAPEIMADPHVRGPHAIFIGLAGYGGAGPTKIKVKLDTDPGYTLLSNETTARNPNEGHTRQLIQDCYFRTVDMTGRSIHIAQDSYGDMPSPAMVAYVRTLPVSASFMEDGKRSGGKRLVAMNDGHGMFYQGFRTEEDLWAAVLPYRESGFSALHFGITGADHCNYPTKVGVLIGEGLEDYPAPGYRRYTESIRALITSGIDPLEKMIEMTRSIGLELHVSIRMEAFAMEPPYDRVFMSRFYREHPEFRCVDIDGRLISRLSYAFQEVREHLYAIIDEVSAYHPDGINLIFPRAQPFLLYEEPFLQEFSTSYGTDARRRPENHPDVILLRARFMNRFMKEVRERTKRVGQKPLEISALVLSNRQANYFYGLDVIRWVEEHWIDEIAPTVWDARRWRAKPEIEYLAEPCNRIGCRLLVNLHPAELPYEEYLPTALQYHHQGADGFSIWDTDTAQPTRWALFRALAHVDEIETSGISPPIEPSTVELTELGGFVMDRYKSSWCF